MEKIEEKIESYLRAIAIEPNSPQTYINLGKLYAQKQQWQLAISYYCQGIELKPNVSWFYHKLGEALTQLGSYQEAVEAYKSAIKLKPEFPWSYQKLGELLMKLKSWDEAILAYRRLIELKPNLFLSYKNLGDALSQLKRWDEAVNAYRQGMEIEPNSYWGNNNLGEALIKLSRFDEAISTFHRAIEIKPNLYFAYHNLGNAFSKLQRLDEAVSAYRRGLEINPNSYWSYHNLGGILEEKGDFEEAALAYCRAIDLNPDSLEIYHKLKTTLIESEIFDKIIVAYLAFKIESVDWEFIHKFGDASDLITKSNIKEAIAYYRDDIPKLNPEAIYYKVLGCLPEKAKLYFYLGNVLAKEGKLNEAIIVYFRGLQIQPNYQEISLQLDKQLSKKEHLEREVVSIRKALELNPKSCELHYNLGVVLTQLQKWEEAANAYRHIIELQPKHIDAYNQLGKVLEKQGLKEEAIAYYQKAIVLQPPRQRQLLTIPANQPIKVKFTDFWKEFPYNNPYVLRDLFKKHYNICVSENPDFLFYSVFGNEHEKYDCTKIFVTGENRYICLDLKGNSRRNEIRQIDFRECDFAISHYYIEDPRYYRLPVYFRHWGLGAIKQLQKNQNIEKIMGKKKKFCCFVYSNKKALKRINFFRKLSSYKKVDSAGKVLNNTGIFAPRGHRFLDFLSEYKFVIAFENSSTPGYTTEKMFRAMQAKTIPIYWGNPWIDREFNSASFINCHDYASDEEVIARVIELDNNEELYREVLAQPYLKLNKIPDRFKTQNILKFFNKIFNLD